ncbi:MAG: hypothetical protein HC828_08055 [Blastochloris sp.]|nr:hypothetical protein [Blastochloris sp.]
MIAHLQIGLLLRMMKAPIDDSSRAAVYLTNSLTGWTEARQLEINFAELRKEHDAAQNVKQQEPIIVILGNPPYYGKAAPVKIEEERALTGAYRETRHPDLPKPQGQGLNDLYVRFFRMAERKIVEGTKRGVVCYISNYSWLDGLSHSGMRERYLDVFDTIYIDSLNGDKYRTGKVIPAGFPGAGESDPSIFSTPFNREGIQVGTAIATLIRKQEESKGTQQIHFRNLWGRDKLGQLTAEAAGKASITYETLTPEARLGLPLMPRLTGAEYLNWSKLPELFPTSFPGVKTSRDSMLVDIDRDALKKHIDAYFDPNVSHEDMRRINEDVMKPRKRYDALQIREYLQKRGTRGEIVRYFYRPFDMRWLYWDGETKLLDEKRSEYFPHVQPDNMWVEARQRTPTDIFDRGLFTRNLGDQIGNGMSSYFPLYLFNDVSSKQPQMQDMFQRTGAGVLI